MFINKPFQYNYSNKIVLLLPYLPVFFSIWF